MADHSGMTSVTKPSDETQWLADDVDEIAGKREHADPIPVSGYGNSEQRAALEELLIGVLGARADIGTITVPELADAVMLGTCSAIELARDIEDAIDEAGWRPPLPDGDALRRAADLAAAAGKTRTAAWLNDCATLPPDQWPAAPAYKGAVVHVEDAEKTPLDLASMPNRWLTRLTGLVVEETRRRGLPRVWLKASPLPADETERPQRCPATAPEGDLITEGRQCQQYEGHAHGHTWYGDNGVAYSYWVSRVPAVQPDEGGQS